MSEVSTNDLIDALGRVATPVRPLRAPLVRAAMTLALLAGLAALALLLLPHANPLAMRGAGDEAEAALVLAAMLASGVLAVIGAFHLAIPGRSRRWAMAPLPPFGVWLMLSGAGCYRDLVANGSSGFALGQSFDCLAFIIGSSLLVGALLLWRLSRASPIDPVPVAVLGGLGSAALSASLLQFFHPFAVTFIDLAFHLLAIVIVMAVATLMRRPLLRPA